MCRTSFRPSVLAILAIPLMLLAALPASAQQKPSVDVGVSWALLGESDMTLPAGWVVAVAGHVTDHAAIVGEIGGNYKSASAPGGPIDVSEHSFLGGGRYAFGRDAQVRPFVQTLVGMSRASFSRTEVGVSFNAFTVQPGAGVDFKVSPKVAVRLQSDFRWMTLQDMGSGWQYRLAAGVVFALGGR
jgi:Outer membrane protein beta-barrel domain